ncbi:anti-phage protein KwaB [Sutterella wadsworthensis]|uniref:anti-phage protein KwaB n=1 Tax=Sutterella wadsworthensis TaxID=40545 RepID=UPI00307F0EA6
MTTIEQIKETWEKVISAGMNIELYLGFGNSESRKYFRANLVDSAAELIADDFLDSINQYFSKNLSVIPLSQIDERTDALIYYDLEKSPEEFDIIKEIKNKRTDDYFKLKNDINKAQSILIKICSHSENIIFFKKFYPISLVKSTRKTFRINSDAEFEPLEDDIIRLTGDFDVMLMGDDFYINDLSHFETAFSFDQIKKQKRDFVISSIKSLDKKGYLENYPVSTRQIIRAAKSQVLKMNKDAIINFVKKNTHKFNLKIKNNKILLNSQKSIHCLYKLLNDDYLSSDLTHNNYEAIAKKQNLVP